MSVVLFPGRTRDPQQVAADPNLSAFVTANAGSASLHSGAATTGVGRIGWKPSPTLCPTGAPPDHCPPALPSHFSARRQLSTAVSRAGVPS